jgi:Flp pilus assembly pilin Flp
MLGLYTRLWSGWVHGTRRFRDDTGGVATEYGLLLFLIAIVITAGAIALGGAINARLQESADCLNSQPNLC